VKRRLEVKAQIDGITIIDDFAHHPTPLPPRDGTAHSLSGIAPLAIFEPRLAIRCAEKFYRKT